MHDNSGGGPIKSVGGDKMDKSEKMKERFLHSLCSSFIVAVLHIHIAKIPTEDHPSGGPAEICALPLLNFLLRGI